MDHNPNHILQPFTNETCPCGRSEENSGNICPTCRWESYYDSLDAVARRSVDAYGGLTATPPTALESVANTCSNCGRPEAGAEGLCSSCSLHYRAIRRRPPIRRRATPLTPTPKRWWRLFKRPNPSD